MSRVLLPSLVMVSIWCDACLPTGTAFQLPPFIYPSTSTKSKSTFHSRIVAHPSPISLSLASSSSDNISNSNTVSKGRESKQKDDDEQLRGAIEFEEWFASKTKDTDNPTLDYVLHNIFSNGRGLEFNHKNNKSSSPPETPIISLPKELVLRSTIVKDKDELDTISDDWDVQLALKLLKECALGKESHLYGYCSLLTNANFDSFARSSSSPSSPPSTAPDTIRNWTPAQKERLSNSPRGQKLLDACTQQQSEWTQKYEALPPSTRKTYPKQLFLWSMEAVHSRAFKGDYGGDDAENDVIKKISSSLVPFAAAAFGLSYLQSSASPLSVDDSVAFVLALVATAPSLLNILDEFVFGEDVDAVLLPFIDSANHRQDARSSIRFDPVKGTFDVTVSGRNCIVKDGRDGRDVKRQLYISYGEKGDAELLLNYGFLKDLNVGNGRDDGDDDGREPRDRRRKLLAETFVSRATATR